MVVYSIDWVHCIVADVDVDVGGGREMRNGEVEHANGRGEEKGGGK